MNQLNKEQGLNLNNYNDVTAVVLRFFHCYCWLSFLLLSCDAIGVAFVIWLLLFLSLRSCDAITATIVGLLLISRYCRWFIVADSSFLWSLLSLYCSFLSFFVAAAALNFLLLLSRDVITVVGFWVSV